MSRRHPPESPERSRFSRLHLLTAALTGIIGAAAAPALGSVSDAEAASYTEDDASNFVAEGSGSQISVGFLVADSNGTSTPLFDKGAALRGQSYGVLAKSDDIGLRAGGDNNSTGVQGISFTDGTESTHGSGNGVEGHSGSGSGVAGFSDSGVAVNGTAMGASGIGAKGSGATGVQGLSTSATSGIGVQGSAPAGTGVSATGGNYGLVASSPGVGARGSSDNNGIGVMGISFTDSSEATHGSGSGVQGNSGTGFGVYGHSDANVGVYGSAAGVSGVGVSGSGSVGVDGTSDAGTGVQGTSSSGTGVLGQSDAGVGVVAKSTSEPGLSAATANLDGPAVMAQNTAVIPMHSTDTGIAAGGVWGQSAHGYGVMGSTSAPPRTFTGGAGVVGLHVNGYGTGVAGYSLAKPGAASVTVPEATGVFGAGDNAGVLGSSGKSGEGVRGVNTGGGTGVSGSSFHDSTEKHLGAGNGVQGNSGTGSGVAGFSQKGTGVYGQSSVVGVAGKGEVGVSGQSAKGAGVMGQTDGGAALKGEAKDGSGLVATASGPTQPAAVAANSAAGPGLSAYSKKGYGAVLDGGHAPVRLVPSTVAGPPRSGSHLTGEMVLDKKGNLFICTASGKPGTWKRVVLE